METQEIKIKVLEGVEIPHYDKYASGIELRVNDFKKVYKGHERIDIGSDSKLANSISQGYITLRPFERALIGTGVFFSLPECLELQLRTVPSLALKDGLMVMNSPGSIDCQNNYEVSVLVYNSSQFLLRIKLGQVIAIGVVMPYIKATFKQVKDL